MSQIQTRHLINLAGYTKFLGDGLVSIDFTSRAASIIQAAAYGDNWHKKMFVEGSGFVAGAAVGLAIVKGGLALLASFTPVGWVFLICAGATIAGTALYASMKADSYFKGLAKQGYEPIMNGINSL